MRKVPELSLKAYTEGTNTEKLATLTVIKHVDNSTNPDEHNVASDWSWHVKLSGTDVASSPQAGSETGTTYTLGTPITLTGTTAIGVEYDTADSRIAVNMNASGVQRCTTASSTDLWAAYTWADVDPAGTGTHETAASPAHAITLPAGLVMRWSASSSCASGRPTSVNPVAR